MFKLIIKIIIFVYVGFAMLGAIVQLSEDRISLPKTLIVLAADTLLILGVVLL